MKTAEHRHDDFLPCVRERILSKTRIYTDRLIGLLVDRHRLLVGLLVAVTIALGFSIPWLQGDPTLKSAVDIHSETYRQYVRFAEVFGEEEYLLVAITNQERVDDPNILNRLERITMELGNVPHVTQVVSINTLRSFNEKNGRFGVFPLVTRTSNGLTLIGNKDLESIRKALPIIPLLLSEDMKTVGILLQVEKQFGFDIPVIERLIGSVRAILAENVPSGSQYRIIGPHIIRAAIQKYNVQTAVVFGILCLGICTLVSAYIFKSLRVTWITFAVVGVSVTWILAFMSLSGIPLNSTTGLSFGLVLVVSAATVIRIVTHFNQWYVLVQGKTEACRQALETVFIPCLMCSATTAAGFATMMVSSIPMVFQLGLIMSLGVMLSFLVASILTPAFLVFLKPLDQVSYRRMADDWVAKVLSRAESLIIGHNRIVVAFGLVLTLVLFAGVFRVNSDTQILRMLSNSTPEMADLLFVERHLVSVHSIEILIEGEDGVFKQYEAWEKVAVLGENLKEVPEVVATESLLSLLEHMAGVLHGDKIAKPSNLAKAGVVPEILGLLSFSEEGRKITGRYLDDTRSRIRISVRIANSPSVPISETIGAIRSRTCEVMNGMGKVAVTGDLAIFADQGEKLVRSQIISLVLAFILITMLLIIQLRSPLLGLISLIPNIPPVATVFGVMGWMGISLDTVTVFAATVALGLAVDDTIHYLAQLKEESKALHQRNATRQCVRRAFKVTAKAMLSTSAILFAGFVVLVISPFRPVVSFGILGSVAILVANLSDIVLLPSVILASPRIRSLIERKMTSK